MGALLALLLRPPSAPNEELQFQLRQLSRELEREKEARARADRQLQQFTEFANQMTESFQRLEARFEQLARQGEAGSAGVATPTPPETPASAPPQNGGSGRSDGSDGSD